MCDMNNDLTLSRNYKFPENKGRKVTMGADVAVALYNQSNKDDMRRSMCATVKKWIESQLTIYGWKNVEYAAGNVVILS